MMFLINKTIRKKSIQGQSQYYEFIQKQGHQIYSQKMQALTRRRDLFKCFIKVSQYLIGIEIQIL
ncbi:hypothetical protein pb186bvf_004990 [Paramecium bursaria]